MKSLVTGALIATTVFTAACSPNRTGSESVYSSSEIGQVTRVERCRVLEVREITIRDEEEGGISTIVGAVGGGAIGNAAGSQIGGGAGRDLAIQLGILAGVVLGAAIGERVDDARGTRGGLEYSVLNGDGEELVIAQEFLDGDRVASVGETCRIQTAYDGSARILTSEQLPAAVDAPETTVIR
ncbi:MAG: hypothetical protein AAFQ51_09395 [Pseudomonadota bacterium]